MTGLVIERKREVLGVVVAIVGYHVEQHQPKGPQEVGMVAGEGLRDLEHVGVVGRRDAKVGVDQVGEGVHVNATIGIGPIESPDGKKTAHASATTDLEQPGRWHVDPGGPGHQAVGILHGTGLVAVWAG